MLLLVYSCSKDDATIFTDTIDKWKILTLVNESRIAEGIDTLMWDNGLEELAINSVITMYNTGVFEHHNTWENIAWGQDTEEHVFNDWMNSPGHRANILNPNAKAIAVAKKDIYWAMTFN